MGAIADAARNDDTLGALVALRDRLAEQIDDPGTPARDMASVSRRFIDVHKEIVAIRAAEAQAAAEKSGAGEEPW
jgi:hypothetical protein